MTRNPRPGNQIVIAPKNDVYTALAATACVMLILGLIAMLTQSYAVFGDGLFMPTGNGPGIQAGR